MGREELFVSYIRVSTDKQGVSGLGLEAQQASIAGRLRGVKPIGEFIEVESGRHNDRPKLMEAMDLCRRTGATLVIAKLDRLSRNMEFIARLMNSQIDFIACDLPTANRVTLHIMAAMAEHESEMISQRTKAALQAAKARGVVLGHPGNFKGREAEGNKRSNEIRCAKADSFARGLYPLVSGYREAGASLCSIAGQLNKDHILTANGKQARWTAAGVRAILLRGKPTVS